MKSILFTTFSFFATIASAKIRFITPNSNVSWTAGNAADIQWVNDKRYTGSDCEIQLLTGDPRDATIVANLTSSGAIQCSDNDFKIKALEDYASGSVFLRIGQANITRWYYSENFPFHGQGSVPPLSLAPGDVRPHTQPGSIPTGALPIPTMISSASGNAQASATNTITASGQATLSPTQSSDVLSKFSSISSSVSAAAATTSQNVDALMSQFLSISSSVAAVATAAANQ
ncbi:hypothetical protein BDF14DRAFT_1835851 [Spinellus fusiger]|nr:hypothetical protein BDF14DRAFT_1835851 [Spinellus fusiger]